MLNLDAIHTIALDSSIDTEDGTHWHVAILTVEACQSGFTGPVSHRSKRTFTRDGATSAAQRLGKGMLINVEKHFDDVKGL